MLRPVVTSNSSHTVGESEAFEMLVRFLPLFGSRPPVRSLLDGRPSGVGDSELSRRFAAGFEAAYSANPASPERSRTPKAGASPRTATRPPPLGESVATPTLRAGGRVSPTLRDGGKVCPSGGWHESAADSTTGRLRQ